MLFSRIFIKNFGKNNTYRISKTANRLDAALIARVAVLPLPDISA